MPEPDRQPSPDQAAPQGSAAHGLRPVRKAPTSPTRSPWPAATTGWPEPVRSDPNQLWGLASTFAHEIRTAERAPEPAPSADIPLTDTPIFGDLQARWFDRTPRQPSSD